MLENDGVGQRSGVSPLLAAVRSQKELNVRCCSVSRKAEVSGASPGPPELAEQAPRARAMANAVMRLRALFRRRVLRRLEACGDRSARHSPFRNLDQTYSSAGYSRRSCCN